MMKLILTFGFVLLFYCLSAQPIVSSFSPASGPVGTAVTITGSNFSATPANNIVYFGGVRATVTIASASSLTVTAPAGTNFKPITVTVNNLTGYSARPFQVTFPGGSPITQNPDFSQNCFDSRIDSTTDLHPNMIVTADFDNDGKPDLATANNYSTAGQPASVSVMRNTSPGGIISFALRQDLQSGVATICIANGDLDGDGKQDLVSGSILDQTISIFRNTSNPGSITFAPNIDLPTGNSPWGIAIADIDGDGKPDIAIANASISTLNTLSVFRNTSSGGNISFAARIDIQIPFVIEGISMGDIDGDGKTDAVIANGIFNHFSVFRNTSSPGSISFAPKIDFNAGNDVNDIAIGDLDGDNKNEIVTANYNSNNISVFRNTSTAGNVSFAAAINYNSGANPISVSIGDVNGDAKPELIVPSFNIGVLQNNCTPGTISFGSIVFIFFSPNRAAIVDLTADGKSDLAGTMFTDDKVSIVRNKNNEPSVVSFTPSQAGIGATVTITGVNFSAATAVSFGGVPATSFNIVNGTTITAVVATGVSGAISVTNQYGTGQRDGFVFAGPPVVGSFNPQLSTQGGTITITGNNFNNANSVSFGGTAAQNFIVNSPNSITATVAIGSSGSVSVSTNFGSGSLAGFTFIPTPVISNFNPTFGGNGNVIVISGSNLQNVTAVSFGGVPATSFTIVNANQINATVGTGASGNVSVTVPGNLTVSQPGFTFFGPPTISSFTPVSGAIGETITINGSYLTPATSVSFGGTAAISFSISGPSIKAIVNTGTSGNVTVTTPYGTISVPGFTFKQLPVITSFTPKSGPVGTTVTINGSNFGTTPSSNIVYFGAVKANVLTASSTMLTVSAPASASFLPVSVTTSGLMAFGSGPFIITFPGGTGFTASSFGTKQHFRAGSDAFKIVSGDLDNDGKPEMISPGLGTNLVSILRNTTAGTFNFAPKVDFPTPTTPESVIIQDINGDGKPDLIVSNANDKSVSVFPNASTTGNIGFATRVDSTTDSFYPRSLAVSDLDRDGKPDLIVVNNNASCCPNSFTIYRNTSIGNIISFTRLNINTIPIEPFSFYPGDIDGDGKTDLAVILRNGSLMLLRNTSTPSQISFALGTEINVGSQAYNVVMGDLDDDGKIDLALSATTKIALYKNISTPGNISLFTRFDVPLTQTNVTIFEVAMADLDGDAKPDLVTPNRNNLSVFKNKCTPFFYQFDPNVDYDAFYFINNTQYFPATLSLGDLDGDGKPEISAGITSADQVVVLGNLIGMVTGVNDPTGFNSKELTVNPNPGDDQVLIHHPVSNKQAVIMFTDAIGRVIKKTTANPNSRQTSVFINDLPRGVYIITWNDGKGFLSRTFMKN